MEGEYFKNPEEKQKLEQVILVATAERTNTILDHFKEEADNIRFQIDEIDRHLTAVKSEQDLPSNDMDRLKAELDQSTRNLSEQLNEYDEQHPLFHENIQRYNFATEQLKQDIAKLTWKSVLNKDEIDSWEYKKRFLLKQLEILKISIENNLSDIDISKVPPSQN